MKQQRYVKDFLNIKDIKIENWVEYSK